MLDGSIARRAARDRVCVFSPFGLGVLDLAVARFVWARARTEGLCVELPDFLPSAGTP